MFLRWLAALVLFPAALWPQESPSDLEAVVNTDLGSFRFEFAPDKAPKHVEQFIKLARSGFYDGTAFHWMKAGAAIQGGDPLLKDPSTPKSLWGTGGMDLVETEISDMKHKRGVISGYRLLTKPNSDSSQFFVCVSPQPGLDGKYSAFGRVTQGLDTVERISRNAANAGGFADKPVRITSITIEKRKPEPYSNTPVIELHRTVTMKTTLGTIRIKMEPDWAPNHVRNFLGLTELGWYNGTAFHRIVKGFVVQGGIGETRAGDPDHPADRYVHKLKAEFSGIRHVRGTVSMARAGDPNSASTSFFLVLGPASYLDGQYSAFGRVVEGFDVLNLFENEKLKGEMPKRRLEIIEATVDPD
jgi:peptidyl-prolyl cis-trans isomerase B (cyclophilin B)